MKRGLTSFPSVRGNLLPCNDVYVVRSQQGKFIDLIQLAAYNTHKALVLMLTEEANMKKKF